MDEKKVEAFGDRLFNEMNAGMSCLSLYLGYSLGLFQALADAGPATSVDVAQSTGYVERYVREWLECMTAGGYLTHDVDSERFTLPEEHAAALLDPDSPSSAIGVIGWVTSFANALPSVAEAFRNGGGVPYAAYGDDMMMAQGLGTRPMFVNDLTSKWIPAMPEIEARLKAGGRVADIGCGIGWSTVALAKGYPNTQIDAIDPDEESLALARQIAEEEGVTDQITFHLKTVEDAPVQGAYDLVMAVECVHDMPYPVSALTRMRELIASDGAVLIADEAVEDTLAENTNFMGHLFYNYSVLHCLPQAMVFPDSVATGTVIKPSVLRGYAQDAGFAGVDVLPIENAQFRFYRLNP
ncbi:MAG: class I SAM-dependent methyltransferase [SAR202 cluster bacterium]|jgi:2-polyprenyl-3-methyl-5-hydroxy-6-metoxy-1,4-benzoquinol methylase|nr:class I SAM-dependent methyltransferase [SAR202 cluster bacterium]MDP6514128.1 class I SAM-dependent methyltransferase [SAR202 cluster bacterium]MDP6714064.1 class I SAM-dependent methyltransferase [SAR202 cluster bacterium]